ncbi:MAG TPA: hypothetical protein VFB66_17740 [Tepidisphaeraceae bacterium]|nr:hypothetical protein [Tepidisphaeraceae bacterium]
MSALTKTFVILHVVMSMLLSAGIIVFVNRVENFSTNNKTLDTQRKVAESRANEAVAELAAVRSNMQGVQQAAQSQIARIQADLTARDKEILDLRTQVAEAQQQLASDKAALASTSEALKVAQNNQGTLQGQLADIRTTHDKLMQQYTEANLSINDLTNRLSQTERQRRDLAEQLAALGDQNTGGGRARTGAGEAGQAGARMAPRQDVNGVIRDRRPIAGIPHATISLGTEDAINKGDRLIVVDRRTGDFLGYVDITSTDVQESVGRLSGPRINDIKPDDEVRARL